MSSVEWTRPKQTLSQQRLNASNTTNSCWRQWTRTQLGLHGSVFTTIPHLVLCNVNFFLPLKAFLRSKEAGCQTLDMRATVVMFGGLLREVKNHPGSLHQSLPTYTIAIYLRKPCKKKWRNSWTKRQHQNKPQHVVSPKCTSLIVIAPARVKYWIHSLLQKVFSPSNQSNADPGFTSNLIFP